MSSGSWSWLPTHCGSCGVVLMGGATEHKPGCEILKLIDEALHEGDKEEPCH